MTQDEFYDIKIILLISLDMISTSIGDLVNSLNQTSIEMQ